MQNNTYIVLYFKPDIVRKLNNRKHNKNQIKCELLKLRIYCLKHSYNENALREKYCKFQTVL